MNSTTAKLNMVLAQLKTWDITDERILNLFKLIDRKDFINEKYQQLAYADYMLPLPDGQCMLEPKAQAKMLQALNIHKNDSVLEIGTGSGFCTALLAKLGKEVLSFEIFDGLVKLAAKNLKKYKFNNITIEEANAADGAEHSGPFDVTLITGSLPYLTNNFKENMSINGRLVGIFGQKNLMRAVLITRINYDTWEQQTLFETVVPPLLHAKYPKVVDL